MEHTMNMDTDTREVVNENFMQQLRETFEQMPNEIPIYMFTHRGMDDIYAQTNRQIVRAFRELSPKITFREYHLDHELAQKWNVDQSPTLYVYDFQRNEVRPFYSSSYGIHRRLRTIRTGRTYKNLDIPRGIYFVYDFAGLLTQVTFTKSDQDDRFKERPALFTEWSTQPPDRNPLGSNKQCG